jgi:hypothetical protein
MNRTVLILPAVVLALACSKQPDASPPPPKPVTATPAPSAAASAAANAPFEGEIVVAVKDEASKKLPASITYDVKGNKVRYAPAAAPLHAVTDLDAQLVSVIDDAQKAYDSIDAKPAANAKAAPAPKVVKSGKTETIAGLGCEDWSIDDGHEKVDVCASKGIPFFDVASDAKPGSAETAWGAVLTSEKAFPLRVVVRDESGKEQYRADATKADRRKIDDAVFLTPGTYKKSNLASETRTASLP